MHEHNHPVVHHLGEIRARIAHAMLGEPQGTPTQLGRITLRPHQQDAVARLHRILQRHHGALLADDVGLGKTFSALGVAHRYPHVHVIAPAPLLPMWRTACTMTDMPRVMLHSLHRFSRPTPPVWSASPDTLVIIDEAHALRHRHTTRYHAIARAVSGCDLLCITATPIHNRTRELSALFALFRTTSADKRPADTLCETLIVRRACSRESASASAEATEENGALRPRIIHHPPHHVPQDHATLSHIVSLPDPVPARDGGTAGALIRLGLLRAWCSSDAALTHALRKRLLRGEALRDALRAGHRPTTQELRRWIVGDDDGQLAFPELLAAPEANSRPLLEQLGLHLEALSTLLQHHGRTATADPHRAALLKQLMEMHGDTPIVAFAQHARTVETLHRALADIAGVALLTGRGGRIASGPITREELLHTFAPRAHGRAPPPAIRRIRLLLTTDLLAEGVNLQDAGVVVHLDLPWTDALRTQRVGRCARLGSTHAEVHVHTLRAPVASRALGETRRLLVKQRAARLVTGRARDAHTSTPERHSALRAVIRTWAQSEQPPDERSPRVRSPAIAVQRSPLTAAIVVLRRGSQTGNAQRWRDRLLVLVPRRPARRTHTGAPRRWLVTSRSRHRYQILMAAVNSDQLGGDTAATPRVSRWLAEELSIRAAIRRWWQHRRARSVAGHQTGSGTWHRIWRAVEHAVAALSPMERWQRATVITEARHCVVQARGAGAEEALRRWESRRVAMLPGRWLAAWREDPVLAIGAQTTTSGEQSAGHAHDSERGRWRLHAALLLLPD